MKKISILVMALGFAVHSNAQKTEVVKAPDVINLSTSKAHSKEPLIIIDGNKQLIRGTSAINGMNPESIESVTVLKNSSATALYGADGVDGVIEIKTKNDNPKSLKKESDSSTVIDLNEKSNGFTISPHLPLNTAPSTKRNLLKKDTDPAATPIYVVNGKITPLALIPNTEEIASVTVLKDAAATKPYGENAKNGVVVIQTKTGKGAVSH